jgi:phosphoribosylaminoimidazole-succinocarboxamide synthase
MGEPIPGKGELLTQMALFWFDKLGPKASVPNHLTGDAPESVVAPTRCRRCGPLDAGASA